MGGFFNFLDVLVECVTGLVALTVLLIVAVFYLPDNPLKDVLKVLAKRIGATTAVTLVGIPIEPIPGVDGVYDIAGMVFLLIYWFGAVKEIHDALQPAPRPQPYIDGEVTKSPRA